MIHLLRKKKHTSLGTGLVVGSALAGIVTYLFYTKNGSELRGLLANKANELRARFFSQNKDSDQNSNQPPAYLAHHQKSPKTDRDKLLKGELLSTSTEEES